MAKFKLCEDLKIITWRRYHYTVEADTLEDALEQIKDGEVDCDDFEELYDCDFYLDPEDNDGEVTREIYNKEDDKLLYDNVRGDV